MRDGRITQSGKYNDILQTGTDFMELVGAHKAALSSIKSLERRPTFKKSSTTKEDTNSLSDFELEHNVENIYDQNDKLDDMVEVKGQLVQEEEREKGRVGFKVYWKYIITAYGGALVPFILLSQTLTVGFQVASNYWMTVATPYEKVLEACSLTRDLEVLPFGDQTIIGEKGINLSGGQKQRVQIARALYQDADIYLFDDPFSAVDAHTGSHLFKEGLLGLLKSKTVIYITHQVEFLPDADLILVMRDGRITQSGKYNDILQTGTDFMELVGAHKAALSSIKSLERRPTFKISSTTKEDTNSLSDFELEHNVENIYDQNDKLDDMVEVKGQLVQEEEREKGRVGFKVYWKYIITAYGGALVPFILLSQTLTVGFQVASNYWMTVATPVSATAEPDVGSFTLMVVYVALAIGSSIFTFARAFLSVVGGYPKVEHPFWTLQTYENFPTGTTRSKTGMALSQTQQNGPLLVVSGEIRTHTLLVTQPYIPLPKPLGPPLSLRIYILYEITI
ncbi:probable non-intrinsic ABC protein 5 [Cajanus cajan]|uniref:probable non-intrinsic ABC protein 5 n=1 Tax=Cajanus cajan TaxID=3821 RepID=UPI00098DAED6|nr:probable non-intrinsic ABC protein 5 [Cajanus cajan]